MMLTIYDQCRAVPKEALKEIQAGRLKGKSDINPMWRIKKLTELFGPCGIGWWYVIKSERLEPAGNGEISAFVDIDLYYRWGGSESKPIPGTGGSSFVANEKNGPYVSDECFKMALTDAISVACKAIGVGADVYWSADATKYTKPVQPVTPVQQTQPQERIITPNKPQGTAQEQPAVNESQIRRLYAICKEHGKNQDQLKAFMMEKYGFDSSKKLTKPQYDQTCNWAEGKQ